MESVLRAPLNQRAIQGMRLPGILIGKVQRCNRLSISFWSWTSSKAVTRKVRPLGLDRYENSAEHSWQIALMAASLAAHAESPSISIG